jgi:hypothetical protein
MIPDYKTSTFDNHDLQQLDNNISDFSINIAKSEIVDGRIIEDYSLINGDNYIPHGLNRVLRGWFPVRKSGNANIYDKQADTTIDVRPSSTLVLNSSAAITVSLWVF